MTCIWWWLRRDPPHDCKALWVYNNTQKALYKCIIHSCMTFLYLCSLHNNIILHCNPFLLNIWHVCVLLHVPVCNKQSEHALWIRPDRAGPSLCGALNRILFGGASVPPIWLIIVKAWLSTHYKSNTPIFSFVCCSCVLHHTIVWVVLICTLTFKVLK